MNECVKLIDMENLYDRTSNSFFTEIFLKENPQFKIVHCLTKSQTSWSNDKIKERQDSKYLIFDLAFLKLHPEQQKPPITKCNFNEIP